MANRIWRNKIFICLHKQDRRYNNKIIFLKLKMSEALENKLKSLNDLNNLRKELKAKTIDRRLTELNLF